MEKETEVITLVEYAKRHNYKPVYVRQMLSAQSKAGSKPMLRGVIKMEKFGQAWAMTVLKNVPVVPKKVAKKAAKKKAK
jgi:hypothetical protein